MLKAKANAVRILCALLFSTYAVSGFAQEKLVGKVVSTKLTACGIVAGKQGTCEGTMVLDNSGKPVTIKVTRDTTLTKANEKVFLFAFKEGSPVTVTLFPGRDIAQSIVATK